MTHVSLISFGAIFLIRSCSVYVFFYKSLVSYVDKLCISVAQHCRKLVIGNIIGIHPPPLRLPSEGTIMSALSFARQAFGREKPHVRGFAVPSCSTTSFDNCDRWI